MDILQEIDAERKRAKDLWPGMFKNYHEAYAVILEEVDELWDEIKKKEQDPLRIREESIQAAAMLVRLIDELV